MANWSLTLVQGPQVEPVSLEEAKLHLRVDHSDEDTYISSLIVAAREHCESFQRRSYITQTWELGLDEWPDGDYIRIPRPPLQSVTEITYTDKDGNATTLDPTTYIVDTRHTPGRVVLAYGKSWPSVTLYPSSPIRVQFVSGYGDAASDVPQKVKQAMLLLIGHWYDHREAVVTGTITKEIELAVHALLYTDRVFY